MDAVYYNDDPEGLASRELSFGHKFDRSPPSRDPRFSRDTPDKLYDVFRDDNDHTSGVSMWAMKLVAFHAHETARKTPRWHLKRKEAIEKMTEINSRAEEKVAEKKRKTLAGERLKDTSRW